MTVRAVLCYILQEGQVLLQRKAAGLWGAGKWNAPGGKCLPGEDPKDAAVRETWEETGLQVRGLEHRGMLHFTFGEGQRPDWVVYVFWATGFGGVARAGDEGELRWHPVSALPLDAMWPEDRLWIPHLLAGHRLVGRFRVDRAAECLLAHRIEPCDPPGVRGVVYGIQTSSGGVPKRPVAEAVVEREGIVGDGHRDRSHGGPDRALCLFSLEVIERLQQEGHPIAPGTTGENITVLGLEWPWVRPGVHLRIGEVEVEVTQYTTPCKTIRTSFQDGDVNRIHPARFPGNSRVYARVLRTGRIRPADPVEILGAP